MVATDRVSPLESGHIQFFCEPLRLVAVLFYMNTQLLQAKFKAIGARAKIRPLSANWRRPTNTSIVVDIGSDRSGEFFDIQLRSDAAVQVLDVQPRDRHLLLMSRQAADDAADREIKAKFLCGHDERHWFVAGIPEAAAASTVVTAKEALKPALVRALEQGIKGKRSKRHQRKTDVFVRQGEWFFVPAPGSSPDPSLVLHNEPLRRGQGKPHLCSELVRTGGTTVYVTSRFPNGLTKDEYKAVLKENPVAAKWNWRVMSRDPTVFVRGKVSHRDHATIYLDGWHRVMMNTESQSFAIQSVAFLD